MIRSAVLTTTDWCCLCGANVISPRPLTPAMWISVPGGSADRRLIITEYWVDEPSGALGHAGATRCG